MRIFLTIFIFLFVSLNINGQTFYGTSEVSFFRQEREKEFRQQETSPLLPEDFSKFNGLNYYEIDNEFRLTATFLKTDGEKKISFPTSSGKVKIFIKHGVLSFRIKETAFNLSVYQLENHLNDKEYKNLWFIPFTDLTNKTETYKGGRYIYLKKPKKKKVILDFNLAFNPSCAYGSDRFSCPIPPKENNLNIEILAGEKKFLTKQ